jgi:hypothetical protein
MDRSQSNLVLEIYQGVNCQCLWIETSLVKRPRWSSGPAQPVFGVPFCLSRNIHKISERLHMFYSSAGHQGSPSACERNNHCRRGVHVVVETSQEAVAKCLIEGCLSQ